MAGFVYHRDAETFSPTVWAGGPWSSKLQHGGPVNGLFARAAEQAALETGLQVTRLTADLFKPVPKEPLRCEWRFLRRGRRVAVIEAQLHRAGEDTATARATALLLQASPDHGRAHAVEPPSASALTNASPIRFFPGSRGDAPDGFHWSIEARAADAADRADAVEGTVLWATTPLELVEGEPTSPLVRCAMLADLSFGLSGRALQHRDLARFGEWSPFINTDTTLYLERLPDGCWFGFRVALLSDQAGVGLAEVDVSDAQGRVGRASQALLANPAR